MDERETGTEPDGRARLGARGEQLAADHLARAGMRILEINWRCGRLGEIDLVAEDKGVIVFVEVKSKSGEGYGAPEEMLTAWKRRRLAVLARAYLQRRHWLTRPARFDVVAVEWEAGGARLRHIRDAFPAEAW